MKTLVLGSNGFIGKSICHKLLAEGAVVYGLSRSPTSKIQHKNFFYTSSTIDNRPVISPLLEQCSHIIHCASDSTPSSSINQPLSEGINNILPTLGLLEILQDHKQKSVVYLSSGGAVYNTKDEQTFTEDSKTSPLSYYGAGKLAIESFLQAFHNTTDNQCVVIRPSNIYGPDQPMKLKFGIIPTIFHHLQNDLKFTIWGDGSIVRDFLYVEDLASLVHNVINTPANHQALFERINAGSGTGVSINELCQEAENVSQKKLKIEKIESRKIDAPKVILDTASAREKYNWEPTTDLKTGLKIAWKAFSRN